MKIIKNAEEAINGSILSPGSRIYTSGNAATPQILLKQVIADNGIRDVDMFSILLLGDIADLFSEETCRRIHHRVIFNGPHSRKAMLEHWISYQILHLSDIPNQLREFLKPNIVLLTVSGPDNGGNYSIGTNIEALPAAIQSVKAQNGLIIAERNAQMPFVLGATLHSSDIDYLIETDYDLPVSPVHNPDEKSRRIGELITTLFVRDGATLQYGIGEVPEAVTEAIMKKGIKDLGIHTELFTDAMKRLIENGRVSNRRLEHPFSSATIFLSSSKEGYGWLHFNSSIQSRSCEYTNDILTISRQPDMIAINSAIGVDLHGNIWADSMEADRVYSGIGGQADFLRGAYHSKGGVPIIAMKSTTGDGISKIMTRCPEGITTTAIPADPVVIVTEHGAFIPRGLTLTEHAVGIAHLADPETREKLMKYIYDSKQFYDPWKAMKNGKPKGFISYEEI